MNSNGINDRVFINNFLHLFFFFALLLFISYYVHIVFLNLWDFIDIDSVTSLLCHRLSILYSFILHIFLFIEQMLESFFPRSSRN